VSLPAGWKPTVIQSDLNGKIYDLFSFFAIFPVTLLLFKLSLAFELEL